MASVWRLVRAELRVRAGDEAGARADVAEQLALARAWGAPGPIGRALRVAGELFGEDLEAAVTILHGSTQRLELAKALLALGRRQRLARRPTAAREPLRQALEVAATCGATALTAEIRGELAAAGARPRTDMLSGPAALTPSERRVATLAADGMTNRDIAEQLFVTPKTIEVHLSAAYRKLAIGSRRELAGALTAP
jgi:DNA-binding NarL/FixJ family response regulator